ncbi:hypothetical protein VCV18_000286 [Metarhizium anisopliae]
MANAAIVRLCIRGGIVPHHTSVAHLYPKVAGMIILLFTHVAVSERRLRYSRLWRIHNTKVDSPSYQCVKPRFVKLKSRHDNLLHRGVGRKRLTEPDVPQPLNVARRVIRNDGNGRKRIHVGPDTRLVQGRNLGGPRVLLAEHIQAQIHGRDGPLASAHLNPRLGGQDLGVAEVHWRQGILARLKAQVGGSSGRLCCCKPAYEAPAER